MDYLNIYYRAFQLQKPHFKYFVNSFCLIFCILSSNLFSQNLSDSLISYKKVEKAKIDTLLKLQKDKKGLLWLNLLPGVIYDIDRNIFNLSLNLSNISVYLQQKQRNRIERAKLEVQLTENLRNDLISIEKEVFLLKSDSTEVVLLENNYKLSQKLLSIVEKQYKNNEINAESFLKFQQEHTKSEIAYKTSQIKYLARKEKLIKTLSHE